MYFLSLHFRLARGFSPKTLLLHGMISPSTSGNLAFICCNQKMIILHRHQHYSHFTHTTLPSLISILQSPSLLSNHLTTTVDSPPTNPCPTNLSPYKLISIIKHQPDLSLALQVFHHAPKSIPNFYHNYQTYHSIIEKLARAKSFNHMETLLTQLHQSQIKCSENLFVTVIQNYGFASRPNSAFQTFLRIGNFGVKRSARSFNTLLNALIQNKRFKLVHLLFQNCRKKFGIIPNVVTCNILIKALCKKNDLDGALRVIHEMLALGVVPNVVTYTTILGVYCWRGDLVGAKKVFDEIRERGGVPDVTTYTVLIHGLCKKRLLVEAVKVMDDMEENSVAPNDVTYGVLIDALCRERKAGEAANLLIDMVEKKYVPSKTLCCQVVDVLCEGGKAEDACDVWKKVLRKNCVEGDVISSTIVYWLCKEGKMWEARKLFDEIRKYSVPTGLMYNTIVAGMCERGEMDEAGRLLDDMVEKGCLPNVFIYDVMIKGYCKVGKASEGSRLLDEMLNKDCAPSKSTYSMLIEGVIRSADEEELLKVLLLTSLSNGRFLDTDSWGPLVTKVAGNSDTWKHVIDSVLCN